jgi:hypothetical protein
LWVTKRIKNVLLGRNARFYSKMLFVPLTLCINLQATWGGNQFQPIVNSWTIHSFKKSLIFHWEH